MREKINRLANGIIERESPKLSITPENMDLPIKSGEIVRMEIYVNSINHVHVKGLVYSSNYRLKILTPSFGGIKNKIIIEIDSRFLKSGATVDGVIDFVTNAGEYQLPYSFKVLTGQSKDVLSELKTIQDFMIIAKEDPETALRVFEYKEFINAPFMDEISIRAYYDAFLGRNNKQNALEEFLIGMKKKEPVKVSLSTEEIHFDTVSQDITEKVLLYKNNWGYLGFAVKTSADFIEVSSKHITDRDFIENTLEFSFKIKKNRLHRGKNEGTISWVSVGQTITLHISAFLSSGSDEYLNFKKVFYQKHFSNYAKNRLHFEVGKKDKQECAKKMFEALEYLSSYAERVDYVKLLRAETYVLVGAKSKAADILDSLRNSIKERRQELVEEFILLEYLDILVLGRNNKRTSLIRLMKRIIEEENLHLLLVQLVNLDEKISNDPSSYFEFFRKLYDKGCRSPYLYILYCKFLGNYPEFLHDMGDFEIHALYCAAKYDAINQELARIIAKRAGNVRLDEGLYFSLLKKLYKSSPEREFLHAVCQAFIKNAVIDSKIHQWYASGVAEGIQLAGLYESFLYSLPEKYDKPLPQIILLYFADKITIDTKRRAALYNNILSFYNTEDDIYNLYIKKIETYALEQLRMSKIDRNLAKIYQKVLRPEMMDETLAKIAPSILSSVCIKNINPFIKSVLVIYPQLKGENSYSFEEGDVYIPVSTDDAIILMQDSYGNRYARFSGKHHLTVDLPEVLQACYRINASHLLRRIARLKEILESTQLCSEDAIFLETCMKEMHLSSVCKEKVLSYLVRYYSEACLRLTGPDEWAIQNNDLLLSADKSLLSQKERTIVCDTLIILGHIREAYEMIRLYDCDQISVENLARLCSKMLMERIFIHEPLLLNLAFKAVAGGSRDSSILEFVAKHFNGSSYNMYLVLQASVEEHTQTEDLEERLLAQLIFINEKEYIDQTFAWYVSRKKTSETLIRAFFTVKSCHYFIEDIATSDKVFEHLENAILGTNDRKKIPVIYQLAITKYYSTLSILTEQRHDLAEELMNELIRADIFFPYYQKLASMVTIPGDVLDRSIVVFHANHAKKVRLRSRITPFDKEFRSDEMRKMVLDYQIKDRILFEGENWEYKIYDISGGQDNLLDEGCIRYHANPRDRFDSRFDCLNKLGKAEVDVLRGLMEEYVCKEDMSQALFGISYKDLGGRR